MKQFYVYIVSNFTRTVLYAGMTNTLRRRVSEHKEGQQAGFTQRYKATCLVYFEAHGWALEAIAREKQIKGYRRSKKEALITAQNPDWHDLAEDE
jgi:putative endonuclease